MSSLTLNGKEQIGSAMGVRVVVELIPLGTVLLRILRNEGRKGT